MISNIEGAKEAIKSQVSLRDLVEAYGVDLSPMSNDEMIGLCPFHDERTPSFGVSLAKNTYYCFGCKAKGDVFSFVQSQEQMGFVDSILKIAESFGVDIDEYTRPRTPEEARLNDYRIRLRAVLDDRRSGRHDGLQKWLEKRRVPTEIADIYELGWSESPEDDDQDGLGLTAKGQWIQTVVVPHFDVYGNIVGFRNRGTRKGALKVIATPSSAPIEQPRFYGFHIARPSIFENDGQVYVVEGEVDCWRMFQHGYTNVISSLGSKLSSEDIQTLHKHGVTEIILIPDGDKAGREFARAVSKVRVPGVSIKIVDIGDGGDPDDALLRDHEAFAEAVSCPMFGVDYMIRRMSVFMPKNTISDRLSVLDSVKSQLGGMTTSEMSKAAEVAAEVLNLNYQTALDHLKEQGGEIARLYDARLEDEILGAAMSSSEMCGEIFNRVKPDDFYLSRNRELASTIFRLYINQVEPTRTAVSLETTQDLSIYPEGRKIDKFLLDKLVDLRGKRKLKDLATSIHGSIGNLEYNAKDVSNDAMAQLSQIVVGDEGVSTSMALVHDSMDRIMGRIRDPRSIVGYDLGVDLRTLNHTIHGLQSNRYLVFAGGSGTGKTAMVGKLCRRIACQFDVPSLVLSFETGRDVLTDRLIAGEAGVHLEKIQTGRLTEEEMDRLSDAAAIIGAAPIEITERGRVFEEAQALIRHHVLTRGVKVVYIDYIQLMNLADSGRMSRYLELGQISGGLLQITQELDISIVAVAQLNRDGAKKGGTSSGHDVGDSFRIYQDADIFVSYMERDDDDMKLRGPDYGNRVMSIDKNRKDGKDGVRAYLLAELGTQTIKEINN